MANRTLVQDAITSTSHVVLRPANALGRQCDDDIKFDATLHQGQVLKWLCVVISRSMHKNRRLPHKTDNQWCWYIHLTR